MGFLSKLFGKKTTKKYENIFMQATGMNQSVPYAFKQAIDAGIRDGVFSSEQDGAKQLYEKLAPVIDKELKDDLEKAYKRYGSSS